MRRINLDPIMTFPDGSHLVISTQCSRDGEFSCALYSAIIEEDGRATFQVISKHLAASTCMSAQEHAYSHALLRYKRSGEMLKKPPYLIWSGPPTDLLQ